MSFTPEDVETVDLGEVVARLIEDECGPSSRSLLPAETLLPLVDAYGNRNGQLFLMTAAFRFNSAKGSWEIQWLRGYLVQ